MREKLSALPYIVCVSGMGLMFGLTLEKYRGRRNRREVCGKWTFDFDCERKTTGYAAAEYFPGRNR